MNEKKKVIAVVGPTASGKTALSIALAKRLNGEIISCDSMQIYKGMDIGTAKPTEEEKDGIVHHMIDIVEPSEPYSAAEYAAAATEIIDGILSRGKMPIFCGGTGLYLDSVLTATQYADADTDFSLRESLFADADKYGTEDLWNRLYRVDPKEAVRIHPNNVKRVVRALEIFLLTGKPKSVWDKESRSESPYQSCILALRHDRDVLYNRIDRRVDTMIQSGLVEEVKTLITSGRLPPDSTAAQAIGYKELIRYLSGNGSLDEAVEAIKIGSRHYAKRQLTWFCRNPAVHWLDATLNFEVIVNNAEKLLTNDDFCAIIR